MPRFEDRVKRTGLEYEYGIGKCERAFMKNGRNIQSTCFLTGMRENNLSLDDK
jgi:hypothetical protein